MACNTENAAEKAAENACENLKNFDETMQKHYNNWLREQKSQKNNPVIPLVLVPVPIPAIP